MFRTVLNSRHACSKLWVGERCLPLAAPALRGRFDRRLGSDTPVNGKQATQRAGYVDDRVDQLALVCRSKVDTGKMQHGCDDRDQRAPNGLRTVPILQIYHLLSFTMKFRKHMSRVQECRAARVRPVAECAG